MNIPRYWATHTLGVLYKDKTTKIKRFGWSQQNIDEAKEHAIKRCMEAKQTLLATGQVKRIEGKNAYPDESGLPIREEIVQEYPELSCITTINGYGAICLNIADVMVLDVDNVDLEDAYESAHHEDKPKDISFGWAVAIVIFVTLISMLNFISSELLSLVLLALSFVLAAITMFAISHLNHRRLMRWYEEQGGHYGMLDSFLKTFLQKYSNMAFHIYETPFGWRLIEINDRHLPTDKTTQQCFDELPVDTRYARLCVAQGCFRARVTGKPWNVSMPSRLHDKDFWSEDKDMSKRREWLTQYRELNKNFRACKFVKTVGTFQPNDEKIQDHIQHVIALHNRLSRCHADLPIA